MQKRAFAWTADGHRRRHSSVRKAKPNQVQARPNMKNTKKAKHTTESKAYVEAPERLRERQSTAVRNVQNAARWEVE